MTDKSASGLFAVNAYAVFSYPAAECLRRKGKFGGLQKAVAIWNYTMRMSCIKSDRTVLRHGILRLITIAFLALRRYKTA